MICITALMDNLAGQPHLAAEHGLSLLVAYEGRQVLFDCGKGPAFLENARRLGISLEELDAVVLSHSHYDHALGFRDFVRAGLRVPVLYTGAGFWEPKYSRQEDTFADRSCGFDRAFLETHRICHREIRDTEQIFPGMWLVTAFSRNVPFETIPEKFVRKTEAGFLPDNFGDEVCLVLEAEGGLVMVVGCSHPGIVNMVNGVAARLGKPVRAIFGGTHLCDAGPRRMECTLDTMAAAGVETLGFSHCSGETVEQLVKADSRFRGCYLGSGDRIFLPGNPK